MPQVVLVETFAESKRLLKSKDHHPISIADQYRAITRRLGIDFSPTIRLLELLPVFLHGDRHAEVRRTMAVNLTAARSRQEPAAQRIIERLPSLLTPGKTLDLVENFVNPLWEALADANSTTVAIPPGLANEAIELLDNRCRLRERVQTNERIREFIESEPVTADQRLIVLGQNALGKAPLTGTITLSLHQIFSANLGKRLCSIDYPKRFPVSAIPVTDRISAGYNVHSDANTDQVTRCVLHSKKFSTEERDELLYGVGEHACLGRPISNAVWSMITSALSNLESTIVSAELTLETGVPETNEELLAMNIFFVKTGALKVKIGS